MQAVEYARFTDALRRSLEADARVLGLVALGSMAERGEKPDEFSDHDFFVIVAPGRQEELRSSLSWLPGAGRIVLSFRETAHGLSVVYDGGHLVEFAVFDPEEMSLARVNRYRTLIDRGGVEERMARVAAATKRSPETAVPGDEWLAGQFLKTLLVGAARHRPQGVRGTARSPAEVPRDREIARNRSRQRLSGRQLVKATALRHLVVLLEKGLDAQEKGRLDDLDPFRRFERVFPGIGSELDACLQQETLAAARGLLDLAQRTLPAIFPEKAALAIRAQLQS